MSGWRSGGTKMPSGNGAQPPDVGTQMFARKHMLALTSAPCVRSASNSKVGKSVQRSGGLWHGCQSKIGLAMANAKRARAVPQAGCGLQ